MNRRYLLPFFLALVCVLPVSGADEFPTLNITGTIKARAEYATELDQMRFSIRHTRLNFFGNVAPLVSYRAVMELSAYGNFNVLDLSGTLTPFENLSFTFGQKYKPFLDPHLTSPALMLFANHALMVGKLAGMHDIGASTTYMFDVGRVPIQLDAGIFNANVVNAPTWTTTPSLLLRANFGAMTGLRSSVKIYNYNSVGRNQHHLFYGATLRYAQPNWRIEAEILRRNDRDNSDLSLLSTYLQGYYVHPIRTRLFTALVPAFRWDTLDQNISDSLFDVNRFTFGLGFRLTDRDSLSSVMRINYEWFVMNHRLDAFFAVPQNGSNRLTLELALNF